MTYPNDPLRIFNGYEFYTDRNMTETVEDWSEVRSPSRAARRRRQGHRQRIRYVERPRPALLQVGRSFIGHPDIIAKLMTAAQTG